MDDKQMIDTLRTWAEHAAVPFQGISRSDIGEHLRVTITTAVSAAKGVMNGIELIPLAYSWDKVCGITVEMDPKKFDSDMLIIQGV